MDEAFEYIINNEEEGEMDTNNMFINSDGLPRSGTLYGIFLNSIGFNTFGLGQSPGISSDLFLKNILIKDLRNNPMEVVHLKLQQGPFGDLVDIKSVVGADGIYSGTAYSNAQYALNKLIDDRAWSVLGHTFITDEMNEWISDKRNSIHLQPLKCNSDAMNHQVKGITGIRIDNVHNVKVEGFINIERLHNLGNFGASQCGKYKDSTGGHKYQQYPLQVGYTGNEVHGISLIGSHGMIAEDASIKIDNLLSARGSVFGLQFYPNSNVLINDGVTVNIDNIHAGAYLTGKELLQLKMQIVPNVVPRSCLFDIWENKGDEMRSVEFVGDNIEITSQCVTSYTDCSFPFWKIDEDYGYDDVLNADYIGDRDVDNTQCVFEDFDLMAMDTSSNVLSALSEYSDYDLDTLQLLTRQQLFSHNIDINERNKHGNYGYLLLVSFFLVLIALIVKYFYFADRSRDKIKANDNLNNEESPLIMQ